LNIELLDAGFCTHDAHPWNVLFEGTTPRFVDFTSIIKALPGNKWQAKEQFRQYCFNPLLVMEVGFPTTARALLREIFSFPDPAMVDALVEGAAGSFQLYDRARFVKKRLSGYMRRRLSPDVKNVIKSALGVTRKITSALNREDDLSDVKAMLGKVEAMKLSPKVDQWSEYYSGNNELPIYDGSLDALARIKNSTPKHLLVDQILQKVRPKSVLDIGCNRGLYSQMAALQGAQVVGVDLDERALDNMYMDSKRLKTNVLPLYVNAVAPAQAIGFEKIPFPSVAERLRSELVMCFALVHHLVFKITRMSFAHIAKLLDSYSEKYLLVEFVPKHDAHIESWYTDEFAWYNLDNFKAALSQYFPEIQVCESFPSPRVILYCAKNQQ
jgi:SAM-dependent methyltransferase